jgi:hypothetical protein
MKKPGVLDDGKQREILAIISMGCSLAAAAEYVGCAVSTIQRTADRDPLFAESLGRARNNTELDLVRNIRNAAKNEKYWRAAAWALERFFPQKYQSRRPDVLTPEQVAQFIREFARMIVQQLPVERYRKNIIRSVESLARDLGRRIADQGNRPARQLLTYDEGKMGTGSEQAEHEPSQQDRCDASVAILNEADLDKAQ